MLSIQHPYVTVLAHSNQAPTLGRDGLAGLDTLCELIHVGLFCWCGPAAVMHQLMQEHIACQHCLHLRQELGLQGLNMRVRVPGHAVLNGAAKGNHCKPVLVR